MINTPIRFADPNKDRALFFVTLRKRVDAYFKENKLSRNYTTGMVVKTAVVLAGYILPFAAILVLQPSMSVSLLLWAVMGFSKAGIGMNVMHDANHGAYSSSHRVNYWLGHSINLIGGAVCNWKIQHNILHHTYTNVVHVDEDIADKGLLRFSPHTSPRWYHQLQFIYALAFYGILTLYWAVLKDFVQYFRYKSTNTGMNQENRSAGALFRITLGKTLYFFGFFFVPVLLFDIPFGHILSGFLLMHLIAGIVLTVIFQLAHTVEGTSHPLPDECGTIDNTWAIHQMNTTVNFSRQSKFLSWYLGGLNFQVEHHLFPNICHVHYPELSKIVKATAEEFNVPYLENKTIGKAIISHIRTLKRFGRLPDINEAIA